MKKNLFWGIFSSFYGQHSVTAAWATPSPWSISGENKKNEKIICLLNLRGVLQKEKIVTLNRWEYTSCSHFALGSANRLYYCITENGTQDLIFMFQTKQS